MKSFSASLTLLLAAALLPAAQGLLRSGRSRAYAQTLALEATRMEAEDARFFTTMYSSMKEELSQLAAIANASSAAIAKANNATTGASATKNASSSSANSTVEAVHPKSRIPKHPNLNPKSVADLIPQLAMLKGLYEDGKERIAKLNEREKENKKHFEEKEAAHKAKLARIEARFANHTLSLEFRTNETRDETNLWKYWERCHQRQHQQYRTGLRIQHATLEKVKKMIDMYEKTISGDSKKVTEAKKELKRIAPPEIVFLQTSVVSFCQAAMEELRSAEEELRAAPVAAAFRPLL